MGISITTVEHGIASALHDVVVGAKAAGKFLEKAAGVVVKDAPAIEALSSLVDPRAASIERIGAALLGQVIPQIESVTGTVANDAAAPSVKLTQDLFAELKALAGSLSSEIASAKAAVVATK